MDYIFAAMEAVRTLPLSITINITLLSGTTPSDQSARTLAVSFTPQRMTGCGNTMKQRGLLSRAASYLRDVPEKTVLSTILSKTSAAYIGFPFGELDLSVLYRTKINMKSIRYRMREYIHSIIILLPTITLR